MQIFIDADACPVVGIVEKIAKAHNLPVTLLCDTNHVLSSDYSEVIIVGAGADAVDYKLISICRRGDIVVSQDYGVAAMALGNGQMESSPHLAISRMTGKDGVNGKDNSKRSFVSCTEIGECNRSR